MIYLENTEIRTEVLFMNNNFDIDSAIRKIKDFPKEGILFYDITSVLSNPEAFSYCLDLMEERYKDSSVNKIAAVEARGFIFAAPLADRLKLPLVLVRKAGKLPGEKYSKSYSLEYGEDSVEVQKCDISDKDNFLVIDDLIATGGTIKAACDLICESGGKVDEIFALVGLPFLNYSKVLKDYSVKTVINYNHE